MSEKYRIFIPNRGREHQIRKLLPILHNKFINTDYIIKIIEQNDNKQFNLAKLTNIGFDVFKQEEKDLNWTYIFQPADCYPINVDYNLYEYDIVYHIVEDYSTQFAKMFCYNPVAFIKMNGYSNDYWGWGGEDSELLKKTDEFNLKYNRRISNFDRNDDTPNYSLEYIQDGAHTNSINLNKVYSRFKIDFLNEGLNTLEYELINISKIDDYTTLYKVNL
jgi:hypothetical protein